MKSSGSGHTGLQSTDLLAKRLNALLADYEIYYQNLRGFHWNISGDRFFELHAKFEEWFNDALVKIDEVAERILALDRVPLHTFSDFIENADIEEVRDILPGEECIVLTLEYLRGIVQKQREIVSLAQEKEDVGTQDLLTPYINQQEKLLWLLRAYLGKEDQSGRSAGSHGNRRTVRTKETGRKAAFPVGEDAGGSEDEADETEESEDGERSEASMSRNTGQRKEGSGTRKNRREAVTEESTR